MFRESAPAGPPVVLSSCAVLLVVGLVGLAACDGMPWESGKTADTPSDSEDVAKRRAAEEASQAEKARLEEESRKKAEEAERSQKDAAERLGECCTELAKAGFEGRSMNLMAATDLCEAASREGKTLDDVRAVLSEPLEEEEPLPTACRP